jgi:hypothetical protein
MGAITTYLANELLDHVLRNEAFTAPATMYVAFLTADPTDSGALTAELDQHANYTSGLTRPSMAFTVAAGKSTNNSAVVATSALVTTGNITVTHVGLMDGSTLGAGNMFFKGALATALTINNGDTIRIPASNLILAWS